MDALIDEVPLGTIIEVEGPVVRIACRALPPMHRALRCFCDSATYVMLPLGSLEGTDPKKEKKGGETQYEFLPSAASILEEVVPASFKVKLFKCFLDSAVSEQIARMVAMKAATENADKIIKRLSMTYNRARQSQITGEIMEVLGGVEALKG